MDLIFTNDGFYFFSHGDFCWHIHLIKVVVQHCSSLLVKNFEGTLSDTIFDKLSVMMVAGFSNGVMWYLRK